MAEGRVTYAQEDRWHVLRYFGRVDYTLAPALDRFVQSLFEDGSVKPFLFDLRQAQMVDSTHLGLLARIAERVGWVTEERASSCPRARTSTTSSGASVSRMIFDLRSEPPASSRCDSEELVTGDAPAHGELLRTMLDAHRTLVSLDDRDRQRFQEVVSMLEAEMRTR